MKLQTPLDLLPPFLCRAHAHVVKGGHTRPMLIRELAAASGLSERSVKRMSRRTTWARFRVNDAFRFAAACGIDLMSPQARLGSMREGKARKHWKRKPDFYRRLMAEARGRLISEER